MKSRRRAREAALQALYQCDTLDDWSQPAMELYFRVYQPEALASADSAEQENLSFARELASGAAAHLAEIDEHLSASSTRWSVGRMCRVDRNILRLAAFEIAYHPEIPASVTINEAIEIAKRYGSEDSPTFINGVLDNLAGAWAGPDKIASAGRAAPRKTAAG